MSKPNKRSSSPDDPSSAPESGDVQESGRNRGQIVGGAQPRENVSDQSEAKTGEEFESGRQDAAPRTGT